MHFEFDQTTQEYLTRVQDFLDAEIYPAEAELDRQLAEDPQRWERQPVLRQLQESARSRGLWNLFLTGDGGAGLTNLQYAPLAELSGRSPKLAPAAMNCNAPDSGNMELLRDFGTAEQKEKWLKPLLDGRIRSTFCMTEPEVASSDATNVTTSIERDGNEYVINGRKWWSSGAMSAEAKIFILMGKTDPQAERHRQQSMILIPRETPGVKIERALSVFGYDDRDHGGHAEISFTNVRVPAANIIKGEGEGFAIAQARLGPGRIHHCMRVLGMAERTLEIMTKRAREREAFGHPLAKQGVVRQWVAESRITIESLRLLVLKTAWLMDRYGNKKAHTEIQAIKIAVPREIQVVVDRGIQLLGGAGLSQDTPLAELYAQVRGLRLADGPDEVHLSSLGRAQLRPA
ncbi:acyl-CoA dehydrogenase family protein [Arthrobacter crystallopoietes]|uniref:Acyl-CoA dehydrogenase n=1 Tax=Crystallibacter crystallopoietes TaxID=37928 RepID=A0A1H1CVB6_9MICC|nr:acyl-CoA dehydrogenase family protein [Arthrobacter crystallopoietes]AUI50594.1 acyl-CoA dehydrogenase [Arthrobacter crystallopoietes]SDQ67969.1 acyl-CoA dehydrogenase [Arthrobacter crystallopoietes]